MSSPHATPGQTKRPTKRPGKRRKPKGGGNSGTSGAKSWKTQPAEAGKARVVLRKGRARPLWFGHPWVYGNAVGVVQGDPAPGDVVPLHDHEGRFIAHGLWNPHSQIPVRVVDRSEGAAPQLNQAFFEKLIGDAVAARRAVGLPSAQTTAYRLVNSEGDGLPGLVVDVFADVLSIQITTLGFWRHREAIFDALQAVVKPRAQVLVASGRYGDVEGFASESGVVRGDDPGPIECLEMGVQLVVEPLAGQKTGMYLDQRPARERVGALARGRRVLDLYAYAGGFALQAARGGAASVIAVDSSSKAVVRIADHAERNGLADKIQAVEEDAFRFLEAVPAGSQDLVIADPPKFARARKDLEAARKGYQRLNGLALRACAPGAVLVTCSCSQNMPEEELERVVAAAAKQSGRHVRIVERMGAGPDHPVPPGFPEGRYLKVLFVLVQ